MAEEIQPRHLSLIDLLDKRLFTIPDYQRSYSWPTRQRKDLFDDIEAVWSEVDEDSIHFMATVVCLRHGRERLGTNVMTKLDIVDGQQRLTTLIILLNAIRYALDETDDDQKRNAVELKELLVKPVGDNLLLLQTNQDTSHFFSNYMRSGAAPDPSTAKTLADRHLLTAIQECKRFVQDWSSTDDRDLLELAALIKNRLTFILHEIADEKTVYTVFEVLNSRGIEVSWLDRLKSILMGEAFNLEEDVTRKALIKDLYRIWGDIYSTLGLRQGLSTEALRFAATLHLPTKPSKSLGEQDAVDELRRVAVDAKSIRKVAEWLLKVTQACDAVKSDIRQDAVTQITQARLLAVALYAKDMEKRRRRELLGIWEKVSFRIYGLWDKDARTGVGDYVRLAWEVVNENVPAKEIRARLLAIGSCYPIQGAIKGLRKTNCYSGWTDDLRYLLFRYEEHLAKERQKKVDNVQWELVWSRNASLSIEHIWPQSEAPEDVKHTLGNLMLLPPGRNSQLGDQSPSDKASSYRETGFYHAAEVADMLDGASWGKRACEKRELQILEWVKQEWAD